MSKDAWNLRRIHFWQAIYEKVKEKLESKGISLQLRSTKESDEFLRKTGIQINEIRQEMKISQKDLARILGISQQMVSRIERGNENISLRTLKEICDRLGRKLVLEIQESKKRFYQVLWKNWVEVKMIELEYCPRINSCLILFLHCD